MQQLSRSLDFSDVNMNLLQEQPRATRHDGDTMDIDLTPLSPTLFNTLQWGDMGDSTKKAEVDTGTTTKCSACLEISNPLVTIPCGCCYCTTCFNDFFESGLANRGSFPPKCCGHKIGLLGAVRKHLDPRVLKRYEDVEEEFSCKNPTYCANGTCGVFLHGAVVFRDFKGCQKCLQQTCIKCKNTRRAHQTDSATNDGSGACPVTEIPSEISVMIEEEEWSRCPSCHHVVEKIEGCDYMNCVCGAEFCYRCGTAFEDEFCVCEDNLRENGEEDEEDGSDLQEEFAEDGEWPQHAAAVDAQGRIRCFHELTSPLEENDDGEGGRCHGCLREMSDIRSCDICHLELCIECIR